MERKEVHKILNEMVDNKVIDDWDFGTYSYWRDVPYAVINGNRIFLCENFVFAGASSINTIYDCKDEKAVKRYIDYIIKHSDILDKYYIDDIKKLKDTVRYEN